MSKEINVFLRADVSTTGIISVPDGFDVDNDELTDSQFVEAVKSAEDSGYEIDFEVEGTEETK